MLKRLAATDEYVFETHRHRPLQVTRWSEKRIAIGFNSTTQRMLIPAGAVLVELTATENCFINFGGDDVEATSTVATDESRLFLAGVQIVPVPLNGADPRVPFTYVAVISEAADGTLQVEELE
jgi:hypothetical protein